MRSGSGTSSRPRPWAWRWSGSLVAVAAALVVDLLLAVGSGGDLDTSARRRSQGLVLEPRGVTSSAAIVAAAALAVAGPARSTPATSPRSCRSSGWSPSGGGNLDQLASAGAAVDLAGAVLAVLVLDRG